MLDKLFRVHSEKNGAAMNGTASTIAPYPVTNVSYFIR